MGSSGHHILDITQSWWFHNGWFGTSHKDGLGHHTKLVVPQRVVQDIIQNVVQDITQRAVQDNTQMWFGISHKGWFRTTHMVSYRQMRRH